MLPVHLKTLPTEKFSQPFTPFNFWFQIHCLISYMKQRSASSIISRGLLTGLGSRCVGMQIIGISLNSFSLLSLLSFVLPQHLLLGALANMSLAFSIPFGIWFLLFLKELQPLTCSSPACHLLLLSSYTHSAA